MESNIIDTVSYRISVVHRISTSRFVSVPTGDITVVLMIVSAKVVEEEVIQFVWNY